MERSEKRKDRRLAAQYDVSCHVVGATTDKSYVGHTVNVSSGGFCFESDGVFEPGTLLEVELSVPPTPGVLEFGGKMAGFARVLRTWDAGDTLTAQKSSRTKPGVAVQFCRPPKLRV